MQSHGSDHIIITTMIITNSKVSPYLHKKECSKLWIMTLQELADFYDQLPELQVSLLCLDHRSNLSVAMWHFLYCNDEKVLGVHLKIVMAKSVISEAAILTQLLC